MPRTFTEIERSVTQVAHKSAMGTSLEKLLKEICEAGGALEERIKALEAAAQKVDARE
jgi:hypothetical protein